MALTPGKSGSYFEFDQLANDKATVVFKVKGVPDPYDLTPPGAKTRTVFPVVVDFVVLTGPQAKTVVRDEQIIGAGFRGLRKYAIGADVVCVMGWKKGDRDFIVADQQPEDSDAFTLAVDVFKTTNGDPYTAAERAANPTGTLTAAPAATPPAAPAPVQPPAANEPGPWQANAPAAQAVGGPQGPGWNQPAVAQPVPATSSAW